MPRSRGCRLTAAALHAVFACALASADLTGTWIGTLPRQGRTPSKDVAIRVVQQGSVLTGKVYNDRGSSDAIFDGTVSGDEVRFAVETLEQSGNQINLVVYEFRGNGRPDGLDLTRERVAARNAATGTEIPVRRPWDSDEQDHQRRFKTLRLERLHQ